MHVVGINFDIIGNKMLFDVFFEDTKTTKSFDY